MLHVDGVMLGLSDADVSAFAFGAHYLWKDTGIKGWDIGQSVKVQIADGSVTPFQQEETDK